jgi:hypothetical protein
LITGKAVPDKDTARVPLDVIGEPDTLKKAGTVMSTEVTVPVVGVAHLSPVAVVESAVSNCPSVPTGSLAFKVEYVNISPLVVKGDKAAKAEAAEVAPVPPFAIGKAVPDKVTAKVPDVVIGEPETLKKLGTVKATDVTVPEPLPVDGHCIY